VKLIVTETKKAQRSTNKSSDSAHYVNNEQFLAALIEHKNNIKKASELGLEKPQVSNYLGECFLKIATHLSYKGNFVGYSYRDDMISDGIENCLVAADKFDPEKSSNPFAYYTQIIYFAFVRRIQKEKKQQATKYKMLENVDLEQLLAHSEGNEEYVNRIIDLMQKQMDTIESERKEIK
jgi:DNA-directed RNA polymerase specialized sigma subunit